MIRVEAQREEIAVSNVDSSPLSHEAWLEFNRWKWGVQPLRFRYREGGEKPCLEAVLYIGRRGSIVHPRLNPYIPIVFASSEGAAPLRASRQWLELGSCLARDMEERGVQGQVALAPTASDMRVWQWQGFDVRPRYTYVIEFPWEPHSADYAVRKNFHKAVRAGYKCVRVMSMKDVWACLVETEERQVFRYGLDPNDLECALNMLGEEYLRAYVCYSSTGAPASARVVLHRAGGRAVDWVAGTCLAHRTSGATQLLIAHVIEDLGRAGATGFDFAGANIANVAASKMVWGGPLVPYYTVQSCSIRSVVEHGVRWLRSNAAWASRRSADEKQDARHVVKPTSRTPDIATPRAPQSFDDLRTRQGPKQNFRLPRDPECG